MRLLRNLTFSTLLATLTLAALELAARLFEPPSLYVDADAPVWTLRPDLPPRAVPFPERDATFTVRTNAAGYRGGPPPEHAVLCLGDSTTFGWGVGEDEAWPARLGAHLGRATVNGGVPGYSTFQGLATLDAALRLRPDAVVLAYLVRDAERAAVPDSRRPTPPRPPDLALLRLARSLRSARSVPPGDTFRVPPDEYAANLDALVARVTAAGARAVVLAFPMRAPPADHMAVLRARGALEVALPDDAFFAEDPIHLTPAGNDTLARAVAAAW